MYVALHQQSSAGAGFRGSLEGWARAGVTHVELTATALDAFLAHESLAVAARLIDDLALTPVNAACGVDGLWEPGRDHPRALDAFARRCEQFASLGCPMIYAPAGGTGPYDDDAYAHGAEQMRRVGDVAARAGLIVMIEFVRSSPFLHDLPATLHLVRRAAHPNVAVLFDCYHFWSTTGTLSHLADLRPGEVRHVHVQDVPDLPREQLDGTTRVMPGDGVAPLESTLRALFASGYDGALSVELFLPRFLAMDPGELAREARGKVERLIARAFPS